ncbi:hypothetical protein UFOVP699_182 [uncultured Caudovirales phage]|uniref:Uncharacterized protein n=1 Tax=uncultured Caudovirales phage TaxID=2100421 RepID=A0A6J5NNY2_9CAUD|nr:hypothetical protein UFOVP699_182 [uncultured Caudovirales phage]
MKQTAVNLLIEKLLPFIDRRQVSDTALHNIVEEHLAMEKEHLYDFYMRGGYNAIFESDTNVEQYYNETFKSE